MAFHSSILLLTLVAVSSFVQADDQFTCCMKGIKMVGGEILCPAPCCSGYKEQLAKPPFLGEVTYCVKEKFLCCMKGWKSVRDMVMCPAPCCPGYLEKTAYPKNLEPLVYCVKEDSSFPFAIKYQ